jgi:hemoglobin
MREHPDLSGPEDVSTLIAAFYAKARYDPALAHFFTQVDWAHHTPRIEAFWNMLLFGDRTYQGAPMTPHLALHQRLPMEAAHFQRWVELFTSTVDEHFAGPKAEEAKQRAGSIAGVMGHRVGM